MIVYNVHERKIEASVDSVGGLLDGLASADDRLWPHEQWPAMQFDSPLRIGARGGHGPVRYSVSEYTPGQKVAFDFENHGIAAGFRGKHYFEVQPVGEASLLRHVIDAQSDFRTWLRWAVVIRPLHDALVEDAFDKAQRELTGAPLPRNRWSTWVRFLRWVIRKQGG